MTHAERRKQRLTWFMDEALNEETTTHENGNTTVVRALKYYKGIEIGPLTHPIIEPCERVKYADRLSADDLRTQYASDKSIRPDKIVNIDYVIEKDLRSSISEVVDFIVASHVVEHVPNIIGWLLDIRHCLREGGLLSLAIPDKRFTFDYCRELSTIDQMVEAYVLNFTKASPRMVYDYYSNVVLLDGQPAIGNTSATPRDIRRIYTQKIAMENSIKCLTPGEFFDTHNWVFTQPHFLKIIEEIKNVISFPFAIKECYDADGCEFIVILEAM